MTNCEQLMSLKGVELSEWWVLDGEMVLPECVLEDVERGVRDVNEVKQAHLVSYDDYKECSQEHHSSACDNRY